MNKILRYSKIIALAVFLLGGANNIFAGEVKMAYTGGTTANMTGDGNEAATFGLDATKWSVTASKGGASNFPGLNKDGDFRLYYNANGSNTITVSVIGDGMKINKITSIVYTGTNYSNSYIEVNGNKITPKEGVYDINATSFIIGNAYTKNVQVRIKSITMDVEGDGQEIVHIANTPETAYSVAKAHELITAGESLDESVYVKGKISTLDVNDIDTGEYGNATYKISDDGTRTNELSVFRGYYLEKAKFTSKDQIHEGDEVIVYGTLINHSTGGYQFSSSNYIYSLNGLTTAISNIKADAINENAPIYNLAGQRVNKTAKGILIQNGKKFVNK